MVHLQGIPMAVVNAAAAAGNDEMMMMHAVARRREDEKDDVWTLQIGVDMVLHCAEGMQEVGQLYVMVVSY